MSLTVVRAERQSIELRLDGYARLGTDYDDGLRKAPRSRGCEVRVLGFLTYDRGKQAFERFDIVGVGVAWGNKMDYIGREIRLEGYPWMYGIACELVTTREPKDLVPPYNLLHYNSVGKYFAE